MSPMRSKVCSKRSERRMSVDTNLRVGLSSRSGESLGQSFSAPLSSQRKGREASLLPIFRIFGTISRLFPSETEMESLSILCRMRSVSCLAWLVHSSSSSDLVLQVVVSADQVRDYLDKMPRHASRSITTNPLYSSSPTLLCIEGVAALVRGEEVLPFASSLPGPPLCPSAE